MHAIKGNATIMLFQGRRVDPNSIFGEGQALEKFISGSFLSGVRASDELIKAHSRREDYFYCKNLFVP